MGRRKNNKKNNKSKGKRQPTIKSLLKRAGKVKAGDKANDNIVSAGATSTLIQKVNERAQRRQWYLLCLIYKTLKPITYNTREYVFLY